MAHRGGTDMKTHHIALKVNDLSACNRFYTDVLDLSEITRHKDANGNERSVWLQCDDLILMLEIYEGPSLTMCPSETPGWHLLALNIDMAARKKWKSRLEKAGTMIDEESSYSLYFRDPEGNRLALSHYPFSIDAV